MSTESDTPLTDALVAEFSCPEDAMIEPDFARKLERRCAELERNWRDSERQWITREREWGQQVLKLEHQLKAARAAVEKGKGPRP